MSEGYELTPCEYCSGGLGSGCDCDGGFVRKKVLWSNEEVEVFTQLIQRLVNDMQIARGSTAFNSIGDLALYNGLKEAKALGFEPNPEQINELIG